MKLLRPSKKLSENRLLITEIVPNIFIVITDQFSSHDVLIFLTGQEEIEGAASQIRGISKVYCLHVYIL